MPLRGLLTSTCIEWRGMISCFKSLPILVRAVSFTERNWISKQYVKTYSFFFKSKKLGRVTKKLIRKSTKCSQSRWRVEERMFRLIHDLFLIIKRFFSFLKVSLILVTQNSNILSNLRNDGRQHHTFCVVQFYWLKVKYQYIHHFLQEDV